MAKEHGEDVHLDVGGRDVRISSPDRVYFPERGETKLELAQYYLAVGEGILRALRERPTACAACSCVRPRGQSRSTSTRKPSAASAGS